MLGKPCILSLFLNSFIKILYICNGPSCLYCIKVYGKFHWSTNLRVKGLKYSKTCVKQPLSKRLKIGFLDQLSLNAGQKYCIMLQGEHSAILLTCIRLPFVITGESNTNDKYILSERTL